MSNYDAVKAQAMKILGEKAVLPDKKFQPDTVNKSLEEAHKTLDDARSALEDAILKLDNIMGDTRNLLKQTSAMFEKDDFGLDPKSKDDQKKIAAAHKIFSGYFATSTASFTQQSKDVEELDKHVIQLGKYKPSKGFG